MCASTLMSRRFAVCFILTVEEASRGTREKMREITKPFKISGRVVVVSLYSSKPVSSGVLNQLVSKH